MWDEPCLCCVFELFFGGNRSKVVGFGHRDLKSENWFGIMQSKYTAKINHKKTVEMSHLNVTFLLIILQCQTWISENLWGDFLLGKFYVAQVLWQGVQYIKIEMASVVQHHQDERSGTSKPDYFNNGIKKGTVFIVATSKSSSPPLATVWPLWGCRASLPAWRSNIADMFRLT